MIVDILHQIDYDDEDNNFKHCVEKIKELKKKNDFYIGATHIPKIRVKQHNDEKKMASMHLLCKVSGKTKTINLEKKLIKHFSKYKKIKNCIDKDENGNLKGGGEGIIAGINYIYVLLD